MKISQTDGVKLPPAWSLVTPAIKKPVLERRAFLVLKHRRREGAT